MATTDPTPEFDFGPLSWVQGEIDQALARGLEALAQFRAKPQDGTPLKHARAHVHQAAGAIQMVGLDAVVAFTDELERQLARLEELPTDRGARRLRRRRPRLPQAARSSSTSSSTARRRSPLKLYPEYEAMQAARGVKAAAPTDLFYPDLAPRAPRISPREAMPANTLPSYLVKQRRNYQRGLLAWLRGDESGALTMRDAIAAIEDVTTQGSLRAFWWTVGALFEGLVERGLDSGFGVEAARGAHRPADPPRGRRQRQGRRSAASRGALLRRDLRAGRARRSQAVQQAFKLAGLIPSAEVLSADVVRLQPLLREAREQLAGAKDAWLKAASGRAENLPKLKQTLASVHAKAADIHNGALMKLTGGAGRAPRQDARLRRVRAGRDGIRDRAAARRERVRELLEPVGGFPEAGRRDARAPRRGAPGPAVRRVGRADARRDEQARAGARAARAGGARDPGQPAPHGAGARRLLPRQHEARRARDARPRTARRSAARCASSASTKPIACSSCASSRSRIRRSGRAGQQRGPRAPRRIAVGPRLLHRGGGAAAARPRPPDRAADRQAPGRGAAAGGARAGFGRGGRRRAARGAAAARRRSAPRARATPRRARACRTSSSSLSDDAELIGDAELVAQAGAVLAELEAGDAARLAAAVDAIADTSAPAPEISEETQRLLATDASDLDRELLEIYLFEAAEVLDGIARRARASSATTRRPRGAAHGAPRLPHAEGQRPHGRPAPSSANTRIDVEKIFNRLLEEERPVTSAVLALVDVGAPELPRLGGCADARRPRHRRPARAARGDRRRGARAARRRVVAHLAPHRHRPRPPLPSNVIELPRAAHAAVAVARTGSRAQAAPRRARRRRRSS